MLRRSRKQPRWYRPVVQISPRYGGLPIISMSGDPHDQLVPLSRQRRRLEKVLAGLEFEDWRSASRCAGWSVQDVVAHLAGVNRFWTASVRAGVAGAPTKFLSNFDPVATPELMVAATRGQTPRSVLDQFVSTNDELLDELGELDEKGWTAVAEAPPGHLPIRLVMSHALWDAWIHERDIGLPLALVQPVHADEVGSSLRYVCALTSAIVILNRHLIVGSFGVEAHDPELCFALAIAETVDVRDDAPLPGAPILRGDAVALTEAISTRIPFLVEAPAEWAPLIEGLATVFTAGP